MSPAGLAGPVVLEGTLPAIGAAPQSAVAPAKAPTGPLLMRDGRLMHGQETWTWAVTLSNPSRTTFDVTVVSTLIDADGLPVAFTVREMRLGGGETAHLRGAIDDRPGARRFRIEYWVRLLPPADRRGDRIGT